MGILKRISDLVRSNVNEALDKAEDPRKSLEQAIRDMQNEHQKAKRMMLESMTSVKQSERSAEKAEAAAKDWEAKAMMALKGGDEDLARKALEQKNIAERNALESRKGVEAARAQNTTLKSSIQQLESKIEEAKRKKDELIARLNAADLQEKRAAAAGDPIAALKDSSAFATFERMVDKIEETEAEVEARAELAGTKQDAALNELEESIADSNADAALEALKAKLEGESGVAKTAAPTVAKSEEKSDIDDELAALRAQIEGAGGESGSPEA